MTVPWEVSDKVPVNIVVDKVINYKSASLKFKDYQNQLVILDFWNTYCTSCIKAWPKLDSLQRKYKDRLLILLVTAEPTERVKEFVAKREQAMHLSLSMPIVTADTILSKLNPTTYNPFYVWIEPGGQVIAKTNGYMLTAENVEQTMKIIEAYRPQRQRQLQAIEAAKKKRAL